MRLPSHQRTRVSRPVRAARALWPPSRRCCSSSRAELPARPRAIAASSSPRASAAQIFAGGGGVAYGAIFSGGSLVVLDYSATHDLKVDSPVVATSLNSDGSRTYVPAGGTARSVAFRISGSLYRVTVTGLERRSTPSASTAACSCAARARSP